MERKIRHLSVTVCLVLFFGMALAEEHVVKALATAFDPMVVKAQPGDTIVWTNMAAHDSVSLDGMIPEGAEAWQSKMGENFSVTVEKEGAYIYKCSPHVSLGMLGAIVVGDGEPANLGTIEQAIKTTTEPKSMVNRTVNKMKKTL